MNRVPMTVLGEQSLREELERLKKIDRPRITRAIAEAREHGDLKENAEYHAAREQQSFAEGRIQELEHKLSHAQIIDVTTIPPTGKVIFGATVRLIDVVDDRTVTYRIVGIIKDWSPMSPSGQRCVTVLTLVQKRTPSMPYWLWSPKADRFQPEKL